MTKTVVITGASRGIGRQLATKYHELGWRVIATARQVSALEGLGVAAQDAFELDVTSPGSISTFATALGAETAVNLLINNAGVLGDRQKTISDISKADLLYTFETNTVGPFLVTQALLENLKLGAGFGSSVALVVNISSDAASITENASSGLIAYRASKTASNSLSKSLAIDLKSFKVSVLQLHPGYVKTDMSPNGIISPEKSVEGMNKIINRALDDSSLDLTGRFYDFEGRELPW
ncbi:hypothetical protein HK100_005251 [Physocladia obscura]|uniref:Short-chain dehydrogenase n=1 Tax=Physocladia obscura TaxID=109957 RepID=A0AAD5SXJ3_9FUNG|nr:hypothetical protein HK100_005251 [Physocladia obscura]